MNDDLPVVASVDVSRARRTLRRRIERSDRLRIHKGTVTAIDWATLTLTATVRGQPHDGLKFLSPYVPVVGDEIYVQRTVDGDRVVIGALTLPPDVPVAYPPSWSGTLGNGTLTGRYFLSGALVHFTILLIWGTTTSHGGGAQLFGLPFPPRITNAFVSVGTATLEDVGTSIYDRTVSIQTGGGPVMVHRDNVSINNVTPFVWGNIDRAVLNGAYERA